MTVTRSKSSAPSTRRAPSKLPAAKTARRKPVKRARATVMNIRKLATYVRIAPRPFNMSAPVIDGPHDCGFIGVMACDLWPEIGYSPRWSPARFVNWEKLYRTLGLSSHNGRLLTHPPRDDNITREMAVVALRNLAKTGRVYFDRSEAKPKRKAAP